MTSRSPNSLPVVGLDPLVRLNYVGRTRIVTYCGYHLLDPCDVQYGHESDLSLLDDTNMDSIR